MNRSNYSIAELIVNWEAHITLGLLTMPSTEFLADAERTLEQVLKEYEAPTTSVEAAEFHELRLQAAIFNYDVCRAVAGLLRDEPQGFALKLCLRDLVLGFPRYSGHF